jgi:hypothetical protein
MSKGNPYKFNMQRFFLNIWLINMKHELDDFVS